jgi:hypothetical protein
MKENATVPCAVAGGMPVTAKSFTWSSLSIISKELFSRMSFDLTSGDMTIREARMEDADRFFCNVTYGDNKHLIFTHHLFGMLLICETY